MPTPKQQLLEMLYDGDLTADIAVMVATPLSWREIAARVAMAHQVASAFENETPPEGFVGKTDMQIPSEHASC